MECDRESRKVEWDTESVTELTSRHFRQQPLSARVYLETAYLVRQSSRDDCEVRWNHDDCIVL
jgi:hypothetical protein